MTDGSDQPTPKHRRRAVGVVVLLGLALTALPGRASADAISDKRAEAKRIAAQREQLTQEAERLNEQAKQTQDELARLDGQAADTTARLAGQQSRTATLNKQAADLAINAYMHGDASSGLAAVMVDDGAVNLQLARGYTPVALGGSTDVIDQARASVEDTQRLVDQLSAQKAEQERLNETLAQRSAAVVATQQKLTTLASKVNGALTQLVAEEQARKEAEAEAAAAAKQKAEAEALARKAAELKARTTTTVATTAAPTARTAAAAPAGGGKAAVAAAAGTTATTAPVAKGTTGTTKATTAPAAAASGTRPTATTDPPAPAPTVAPPENIPAASPAAGIAVAEALRQLGKRYVFGAVGPDTFDCSGLTMWAWAAAGVSMPHYTVSQFQAFPHVPLDQLQPGDLVFFNLNLGHVGMYIGDGKIVHAPRTGDVVKIGILAGRSVVGAIRPG